MSDRMTTLKQERQARLLFGSRRALLRSSTAGLLMSSVLGHFRVAEGAPPPSRLVLVFVGSGWLGNQSILATGDSHNSTSFSFHKAFEAFEPLKAYTTVPRKMNYQVLCDTQGDGHWPHQMTVFTGSDAGHCGNGCNPYAMSPSIDQIIAWDYLKRGVIADATRSALTVGLGAAGRGGAEVSVPVPTGYTHEAGVKTRCDPKAVIGSPLKAFEQLFGKGSRPAAMTGASSLSKLLALRMSVLDGATADLASMRQSLPKEGQQVLDRHGEQIRSLEKALASRSTNNAGTGGLTVPADDAAYLNNQTLMWQDLTRILVTAMRLDVVRVATISFRDYDPDEAGNKESVFAADLNSNSRDHHTMSHYVGNSKDAPKRLLMDRIMAWYNQKIASLAMSMKDTSGGGENLLESSLLFYPGEATEGLHVCRNTSAVMIGKMNGAFTPGRVIELPSSGERDYRPYTSTLRYMVESMGVSGVRQIGERASSRGYATQYSDGEHAAFARMFKT